MIILDASVVVSAALVRGSVPDLAFRAALRDPRGLAISTAIVAEITGVLFRPKLGARLPPGRAEEVLALLDARGGVFEPSIPVTDCRDLKDNKYLELAVASRAGVIVSGDADLLVLHPWRGVRVIAPAAFLADALLT